MSANHSIRLLPLASNILHSLAAATTSLTLVVPACAPRALAQQPWFRPQVASQESTIPPSTAITAAFLAPMEVDASQSQEYPTTLRLVQPILDGDGNVVAPRNSPVSARLKPQRGGVKIIAESLVIGGRVVPIQASSPVIPGRTTTIKSGNQQAQENSPVFSNLLGSLAGFATEGRLTQQAGMLGASIGILAGLASPEKVRMVQIQPGSVYVLRLETPVALMIPKQPAQNQSPTAAPQVNLSSVREYTEVLERVLQDYQSGKISRTEAMNLIMKKISNCQIMTFSDFFMLAKLSR